MAGTVPGRDCGKTTKHVGEAKSVAKKSVVFLYI